MKKEELWERQKWTLEQKIDHAVGTVEAFVAKVGWENVYVSFSGGKDSTVLLDIVRRFLKPDVRTVFCNTGNEWPEIVSFVRSVEGVRWIKPKMTPQEVFAKYGFPLVSKEQAQYIKEARNTKSPALFRRRMMGMNTEGKKQFGQIAERWRFLIFEPFKVSDVCCRKLKKDPFLAMTKEGMLPIMGIMAGESRMRESMYVQRGGCNEFEGKHKASYPLSIWTDKDVWAYIRRFDVSYCDIYDKGADRTGCVFCGFGANRKEDNRFMLLAERYPRLYEKCMGYENNGVRYEEALRKIGANLPDKAK